MLSINGKKIVFDLFVLRNEDTTKIKSFCNCKQNKRKPKFLSNLSKGLKTTDSI